MRNVFGENIHSVSILSHKDKASKINNDWSDPILNGYLINLHPHIEMLRGKMALMAWFIPLEYFGEPMCTKMCNSDFLFRNAQNWYNLSSKIFKCEKSQYCALLVYIGSPKYFIIWLKDTW